MANVRTHSVLLTFGLVCLVCGLVGIVIHPEVPPPFEALRRSQVRVSMAMPGRQHCGRVGQPLMGHDGAWVLGVMFEGREHCFVIYPASDQEARRLERLPPLAEVTALHERSVIWQLEDGEGPFVSYEAELADAKDAGESRRWAQAVYWGLGLLLVVGSISLRRKARRTALRVPVA